MVNVLLPACDLQPHAGEAYGAGARTAKGPSPPKRRGCMGQVEGVLDPSERQVSRMLG